MFLKFSKFKPFFELNQNFYNFLIFRPIGSQRTPTTGCCWLRLVHATIGGTGRYKKGEEKGQDDENFYQSEKKIFLFGFVDPHACRIDVQFAQ